MRSYTATCSVPSRHRATSRAIVAALAMALALGGPAAPAAQAQVTTYTSYAAWLANLTGARIGTDTYDDLGDSYFANTPLSRVTTGGTHSYRILAYYNRARGVVSAGAPGDYWLVNYNAMADVTFDSFSPGVYAIGGYFFTSNVVFAPAAKDVRIHWRAGTFADSATFSGATPQFFGIISTAPIDSVRGAVMNPGADVLSGEYVLNVNDLRLASTATVAVPEPGTSGLVALGVWALGVAARRRRHGTAGSHRQAA